MSARDPKTLILDTALKTFVELGFEQATMAQICARAGISNGALFHHFPTKDAIGEALYVRGIAAYQEGLVRALADHEGEARETLRAAVQHHLAFVEKNRSLAFFMYERGRPDWQPAQGAAVRKLNRSTAAHVRDWIAPLAAAGVLRDLPLPVLAACVVGPAHFIARRWLSGMITARPTSFADTLADAAWAALAPDKPRRAPAPSMRLSPAGLIESAALDAASDGLPDAWRIVHMSVSGAADAVPSSVLVPQLQSLRREGDSALVDIDLVDGDGRLMVRGHAVCLRRADRRGADKLTVKE